MNPEVKEIFVGALRSGEYTQTHDSVLETPDGCNCALGVLAREAVKAGVIPEPWLTESGNWVVFGRDKDSGDVAFLPKPVREWAGYSGGMKIAELNDDKKWSFNRIADWVEENL